MWIAMEELSLEVKENAECEGGIDAVGGEGTEHERRVQCVKQEIIIKCEIGGNMSEGGATR